jgi:uncharacterized protein
LNVYEFNGVSFALEKELESYQGATLVTGFRGFGMVGYNVSKYLALGLGASKVGFIVSEPMPPIVVVEEDGVGFPYDIYYSPRAHTLIIVNRALPEKEHADKYTKAIAEFAKKLGVKFSVLAGGLNSNFRPEDEKHEYRHLKNKYYRGPELEAPEMEEDLGVMGPLALLYIYMTLLQVPAVIVLPYAVADQIDINAARVGIQLIAEKLLGASVNLRSLEEYERKLALEKEKIMRMIAPLMQEAEEEREEERRKGIYM